MKNTNGARIFTALAWWKRDAKGRWIGRSNGAGSEIAANDRTAARLAEYEGKPTGLYLDFWSRSFVTVVQQ